MTEIPKDEYRVSIPINKLTIYRQAAELTGVELSVIAKEGEKVKFDGFVVNYIEVLKGRLAISLSREKTLDGFQDYFATVTMIEAELPNVR